MNKQLSKCTHRQALIAGLNKVPVSPIKASQESAWSHDAVEVKQPMHRYQQPCMVRKAVASQA